MKREYDGPAIDGTYQHITEEKDGETISGTSDDEKGEVSTEVGDESDTSLQKKIKLFRLKNPDTSIRDIADELDCHYTYVCQVLNQGKNRQRRTKESVNDLTETQAKIAFICAFQPDRTNLSIAEQVGVNDSYVSTFRSDNGELINRIAEEYDAPDSAVPESV